MDGFEQMRRVTTNADVVRRAEAGIRDSRKQIAYFEETLMQLRGKQKHMQSGASMSYGGSTTSNSSSGYPRDSSASYTSNSSGSFDSGRGPGDDRPLPPPPPDGAGYPTRTGSPGSLPGMYGYSQGMGGPPGGGMHPGYGGAPGQWTPNTPVGRAGTTTGKQTYTNLGKCQ